MISKKNGTKFVLMISLAAFIVGCQTGLLPKKDITIEESQVLAEWSEEKITENEFESRLELALKLMPAYYRPKKGFTLEQKQKYLESYALEDIFYLEALEMGTDKSTDTKKFYEEKAFAIILREYIKNEVREKISVTDTLLKIFYEENKEIFPSDKPFEDIKISIEKNYKAQKEKELMKQLSSELLDKYEVYLDTIALKNINFEKADTSETEANIQLIKSPIEKIIYTVKNFADDIKKLPAPQKQTITEFNERKEFLTQKMKNKTTYYDAIQKGYEQLPELEEILFRLKKYGALRQYYKLVVLDSVVVSDEEIKEIYENQKEEKYPSQEFEKVAPKIEEQLSEKKQRERFEELKEKITRKHNLKLYPERLEKILPADTLFNLAENFTSQRQYESAINYYDQIIKHYKNNDDDYKAFFMKGFLYLEYLSDEDLAKELFEQVLAFPKGELHDDAKYMIKFLKGEDDILDKINETSE